MSPLTFEPIAVPLRQDADGAIRIGRSRVLLDLVVHEFREGTRPEEIVEAYDTLTLPEVYAVLSYYLQHPGEVDAYLKRREQEAGAIRAKIEASQPPRPDLRAELRARADARKKADARAD